MKYLTASLAVIALALGIALIMTAQSCNRQKANFTGEISLQKAANNDTANYYIAKDGYLVSEVKAVTVTNTDLNNKNAAANGRIASLMAEITNLKLNPSKIASIDKQDVSGKDTNKSVARHDSIKPGKCVPFVDSTRWSMIRGLACIDRTIITDREFKDTVYTVQMTDGRTAVAHKNPYIVTTNLLIVDVVKPKRFYDRFWFHFALGAAAGIITAHYLLK